MSINSFLDASWLKPLSLSEAATGLKEPSPETVAPDSFRFSNLAPATDLPASPGLSELFAEPEHLESASPEAVAGLTSALYLQTGPNFANQLLLFVDQVEAGRLAPESLLALTQDYHRLLTEQLQTLQTWQGDRLAALEGSDEAEAYSDAAFGEGVGLGQEGLGADSVAAPILANLEQLETWINTVDSMDFEASEADFAADMARDLLAINEGVSQLALQEAYFYHQLGPAYEVILRDIQRLRLRKSGDLHPASQKAFGDFEETLAAAQEKSALSFADYQALENLSQPVVIALALEGIRQEHLFNQEGASGHDRAVHGLKNLLGLGPIPSQASEGNRLALPMAHSLSEALPGYRFWSGVFPEISPAYQLGEAPIDDSRGLYASGLEFCDEVLNKIGQGDLREAQAYYQAQAPNYDFASHSLTGSLASGLQGGAESLGLAVLSGGLSLLPSLGVFAIAFKATKDLEKALKIMRVAQKLVILPGIFTGLEILHQDQALSHAAEAGIMYGSNIMLLGILGRLRPFQSFANFGKTAAALHGNTLAEEALKEIATSHYDLERIAQMTVDPSEWANSALGLLLIKAAGGRFFASLSQKLIGRLVTGEARQAWIRLFGPGNAYGVTFASETEAHFNINHRGQLLRDLNLLSSLGLSTDLGPVRVVSTPQGIQVSFLGSGLKPITLRPVVEASGAFAGPAANGPVQGPANGPIYGPEAAANVIPLRPVLATSASAGQTLQQAAGGEVFAGGTHTQASLPSESPAPKGDFLEWFGRKVVVGAALSVFHPSSWVSGSTAAAMESAAQEAPAAASMGEVSATTVQEIEHGRQNPDPPMLPLMAAAANFVAGYSSLVAATLFHRPDLAIGISATGLGFDFFAESGARKKGTSPMGPYFISNAQFLNYAVAPGFAVLESFGGANAPMPMTAGVVGMTLAMGYFLARKDIKPGEEGVDGNARPGSFFHRLIPGLGRGNAANTFTFINMAAGWAGVAAAVFYNDPITTVIFSAAGMGADFFDGWAARKFGGSPEGGNLDSKADLLNFGVAGSLAAAVALLGGPGVAFSGPAATVGVLIAAGFYALGADNRLAFYDANKGDDKPGWFRGAPSPAAAAVVASSIVAAKTLGSWGVPIGFMGISAGLGLVSLGIMMNAKPIELPHFGKAILPGVKNLVLPLFDWNNVKEKPVKTAATVLAVGALGAVGVVSLGWALPFLVATGYVGYGPAKLVNEKKPLRRALKERKERMGGGNSQGGEGPSSTGSSNPAEQVGTSTKPEASPKNPD